MKRKSILSAAFVVSLLPMLMNQYGGRRGVQEITGMLNLFNPMGILSVVLFAAGVWMPLRRPGLSKLLGAMGAIGMVASELYTFLTWHILTITGEMSLQNSFAFAYPEFYLGLAVSLAMVAAYFVIDQRVRE